MTNLNAGSFGLVGPYDVANQRLTYQAVDSPLRQGSYRGLAATANTFARECFMDELAALAGQDPLAFRLAHLAEEQPAKSPQAVLSSKFDTYARVSAALSKTSTDVLPV